MAIPGVLRHESDIAPASAGRWEWTSAEAGQPGLALHGRLDATATFALWQHLKERQTTAPGGSLVVDASGVDQCDGAGIALLQSLAAGRLIPGMVTELRGLRPEFTSRMQVFTAEDYEQFRAEIPRRTGTIEEVGVGVRAFWHDLREQIEFLGAIARAFVPTLIRRNRRRWPEIKRVFELAGANALPIISLMSLLVGFIIAFEAAGAFAMFGAEIFMANMLGVIMTRELGPLLTAVMIAGRSGSAFAAELGTMKVNEELNALETMGLDPIRFLVVQRIVAGMLLTPLLTIYAMVLGVGGGVVVMMGLGFPLPTILVQMRMSVGVGDIALGVGKGLVFGAIVATIGCLRGLQTARGPAAVGASTTRAVVAGILLVIAADAVFSIVSYALKS